jgi:hypothetical protein
LPDQDLEVAPWPSEIIEQHGGTEVRSPLVEDFVQQLEQAGGVERHAVHEIAARVRQLEDESVVDLAVVTVGSGQARAR